MRVVETPPFDDLNEARAIRKREADENKFYRYGNIILHPDKSPVNKDWGEATYNPDRDESWENAPLSEYRGGKLPHLQGVLDVDSKGAKPEDAYNYCHSVFRAAKWFDFDTSHVSGRKSIGAVSHYRFAYDIKQEALLLQLINFMPRFQHHGVKYGCEPLFTRIDKGKEYPKQVALPGILYDGCDLRMRANPETGELVPVESLPIRMTTQSYMDVTLIPRINAFGGLLCVLRPYLSTEGERHLNWRSIAGLMARLYVNKLTADPLDPFGSKDDYLNFIEFFCNEVGDLGHDGVEARKLTFINAVSKLERNPDANIPGFPAVMQLCGEEDAIAIKTLINGAEDAAQDILEEVKTKVIPVYGGKYLNLEQFRNGNPYEHSVKTLLYDYANLGTDRGFKGKQLINMYLNSPRRPTVLGIVNIIEPPNLDCSPSNIAGKLITVECGTSNIIPEDVEYEGETSLVFNEWRGWGQPAVMHPDPAMRDRLTGENGCWWKLLSMLTRNNQKQMHLLTSALSYKVNNPRASLQQSFLILGDQGTGKSSFVNFVKLILDGERKLSGMVAFIDPNLVKQSNRFVVGTMMRSLVNFVDEAAPNAEGTAMLKLLNRGGVMQYDIKHKGAEQGEMNGLMIYAANPLMNLSDIDSQDRAIFVVRSVDAETMNMQLVMPNPPSWKELMKTVKAFVKELFELMEDEAVRSHFLHFLATYQAASKEDIEDIEHSSGSDVEVIEATASLHRRLIRTYVERGGITEKWNYAWYEEDITEWVCERISRRGSTLAKDSGVADRFRAELLKHRIYKRHKGMFWPLVPQGTAARIVRENMHLVIHPTHEFTDEECRDALPEAEVKLPPPRKY
jgi:hypothetical protein